MAALLEPTDRAFDDLEQLLSPDEVVALIVGMQAPIPIGWTVLTEMLLDQMVHLGGALPEESYTELGPEDLEDMLALTALTEPGPFRKRTPEMGRYIGIRSEDGRLAAMAGERLKPIGFTEVSAVCTHPDFRGRGYAGRLIQSIVNGIHASGETPFLHVKDDNQPAKKVYFKLGFELRKQVKLTVLKRG